MSFDAEAQIVREIGKFLVNGGIYKGSRPVLWSVVEKTALADAEVEYHDHVSTTIWVRFPVVSSPEPLLEGASVLIWTTTPWTIPGNRAVAFGEDIAYGVWRVDAAAEGNASRPGDTRAEERRVGEECGGPGRLRWARSQKKKKIKKE